LILFYFKILKMSLMNKTKVLLVSDDFIEKKKKKKEINGETEKSQIPGSF